MDVRTKACTALSRRLMRRPDRTTADIEAYADWRGAALSASWSHFSDSELDGKDVLDFGCGQGQLSLLFASKGLARSITGVDIDPAALARARGALASNPAFAGVLRFLDGTQTSLPLGDASVDLIVAFDCMEHVMAPHAILKDWARVLRPGGRVLIEWFPFKGPWGPHMEALIPVPWAHILFGERAMFRAAAAIYDDPDFVPRHWDLTPDGQKKPNKWKQWESFAAQAYLNQLDLRTFRRLAADAGFRIDRFDRRGFGQSGAKKLVGDVLMATPGLGEYTTSHVVIALTKPG